MSNNQSTLLCVPHSYRELYSGIHNEKIGSSSLFFRRSTFIYYCGMSLIAVGNCTAFGIPGELLLLLHACTNEAGLSNAHEFLIALSRDD